MRNKSNIVFFTIIVIIFIVSSCKTSNKLVVNLITKSETSEEIEHISISSNGKIKKVDAFISHPFQIFNADSRSFSSYISNNKVLNRINKIVLEYSDGNVVDNDEIITGIFQSAEKLEHDIWGIQIFKDLDNYFVLAKLNVNWQSPCDFYEYDKTDKELKLLHRFQGIDITKISLSIKE